MVQEAAAEVIEAPQQFLAAPPQHHHPAKEIMAEPELETHLLMVRGAGAAEHLRLVQQEPRLLRLLAMAATELHIQEQPMLAAVAVALIPGQRVAAVLAAEVREKMLMIPALELPAMPELETGAAAVVAALLIAAAAAMAAPAL